MTQTDADMHEERQPHPLSLIELLPTEVLVAILSAAPSTSDLHAFIRASPTVYQVFLSAKRAVLVSIVASELGPALRDAVASCLIAPAVGGTIAESERVIKEYEALPRGDGGWASARGLSTDETVVLVQASRRAQYLIDVFEASRRPELRVLHPDAAGPMTTSERRRLAAALFRHQTLVCIEHDNYGYSLSDEMAVVDNLSALFRPWELHQLADVHRFLGNMASLRDFSPSVQEASRDLDLLRSKVVAKRVSMAANPEVPVTGASAPWGVGLGGAQLIWGPDFLTAGPLPGRMRSAEKNEQYRREDAMPPLVAAEDDEGAPPFAWVDGHDGLNCQRWGNHVRRGVLSEGQDGTTYSQRRWMKQNLDLWRWLGFPFWDRGRVQLLKTGMPVWETGWLTVAPPSNEECEEFYDEVRKGKMIRHGSPRHIVDGYVQLFRDPRRPR
jgi:hypothetical protein